MKKSTRETQLANFKEALAVEPMTTAMASVKLGIMRCNLTRYVAELESRNEITIVKTDKCEITGHTAAYYSTDPKYFEPETQGSLFPEPAKSAGVLR